MISGAMPKWRRNYHTIACGFMCLLFGGFGLLTLQPLFQSPHLGKRLLIGSAVYAALAALGMATLLWFRRRIISEFMFDGHSLRFRTLGISRIAVRDLSEVAAVGGWRGRSGDLGYRLIFRDGAKVYLEYSVSNSRAVAEQLQSHIPAP
jgi:hypothetical protein